MLTLKPSASTVFSHVSCVMGRDCRARETQWLMQRHWSAAAQILQH